MAATSSRRAVPQISIEQVRAFVELARTGNIRSAARELHLSEEGLRGRLLSLEERLGVHLYEKERGRRTTVHLTQAGQASLEKAIRLLEEAMKFARAFEPGAPLRELRVAASHYAASYLLTDILRDFHAQFPNIVVHVSVSTEQQVVSLLQADAGLSVGICAPEEFSPDLVCHPCLPMDWHFVAPRTHPLLLRAEVSLADIEDEQLVMLDAGTTGRQHVLEAFFRRGLAAPRVVMEVTTIEAVLRLVQAGVGSAILPMLRSGAMTRDLEVGQVPVSDEIRKVDNAVIYRPALQNDPIVRQFLDVVLHKFRHGDRIDMHPRYDRMYCGMRS